GGGDARAGEGPSLDALVEDAFAFSEARVLSTVETLKRRHPKDFLELYPTSTETSGEAIGEWKYGRADDWRSGFVPGVLWQLYRKTGDDRFERDAEAWTVGIEGMKNRPIDYDQGNRFMASFGQGYRLRTGPFRSTARDVILTAAASLDTRFDMGGIPVGAL